MKYNLELIKNKKKIIGFSTVLIFLSLLGILYSTFNTSYKKPINLGMDFVGGNELRIERVCYEECSDISPDSVLEKLRGVSKNKKLLTDICEPVDYIPEMIKADQLLTRFDKNHKGVKVVVDEFGGFVGIIGAEVVLSVLAGWWKNKS